eukprot:2221026-Pleurochrysis_carterae.AAC.1
MLTAAAHGGDGAPARGVAQFTAAIWGDAQASAAVEAALVAAQGANHGGGEQAGDAVHKMVAAGR